jgi:hypothetical protein
MGIPPLGRAWAEGEEMTDQEQLIEEIRERLSNLKEAGSMDPIANALARSYSITVEEICLLVTREADAAGISHL